MFEKRVFTDFSLEELNRPWLLPVDPAPWGYSTNSTEAYSSACACFYHVCLTCLDGSTSELKNFHLVRLSSSFCFYVSAV